MDHELLDAVARARAAVEAERAELEALESQSDVPKLRKASAHAKAETERLEARVAKARAERDQLAAKEAAAWESVKR